NISSFLSFSELHCILLHLYDCTSVARYNNTRNVFIFTLSTSKYSSTNSVMMNFTFISIHWFRERFSFVIQFYDLGFAKCRSKISRNIIKINWINFKIIEKEHFFKPKGEKSQVAFSNFKTSAINLVLILCIVLNFSSNFLEHKKKLSNKHYHVSRILNSERSDECIDFTMLCFFFFFVSVYTRKCGNNARISNFGVGALGRSFFEIPNSFQKRREKPKKNYGKTGIFTQNQFSTKSIFLYGCNSKTNHYKYLKFSPNFL
ncbi:Uncharacterized protein FWK35_00025123, partial [Aphis craccivora]